MGLQIQTALFRSFLNFFVTLSTLQQAPRIVRLCEPDMEGDVIIAGKDISAGLRSCDVAFRDTINVVIDRGDLTTALYLTVMKNKLARFASSVKLATNPEAAFPMAIGDYLGWKVTMDRLLSLERVLVSLRTSTSTAAGAHLRIAETQHVPSANPDVAGLLREVCRNQLSFQRVGFPKHRDVGESESSQQTPLLEQANFDTTNVYERFSETYGPQRILAASEAAELARAMGSRDDAYEVDVINAVLFDVDLYLYRALEGLHFERRGLASPLGQEVVEHQSDALPIPDAEQRKKRGFGPHFFDDSDQSAESDEVEEKSLPGSRGIAAMSDQVKIGSSLIQ